jgi:hypothetical protein
LKETRARLANKEEHENKETLSTNPVEQKEVANKAFFQYPEKRGLLWVLSISCDKALELTQGVRTRHNHPVYSNDCAGYHTLLFYLAKFRHKFSEGVDVHHHEQF